MNLSNDASSALPDSDYQDPLNDDLQVVHTASLIAVLSKVSVKIPIEDLIKVIHNEDDSEANHVKTTAEVTPVWR